MIINKLIEKINASICDTDSKIIEEALTNSGYIFEKYIYREQIDPLWPLEIKDNIFNNNDIVFLKKILVRFIETTHNKKYILSAINSISKLYDSSLKFFFITQLEYWIKIKDDDIIYQIMIALDNIDENVFTSKSISMFDHEENFKDAKNYLIKIKLNK